MRSSHPGRSIWAICLSIKFRALSRSPVSALPSAKNTFVVGLRILPSFASQAAIPALSVAIALATLPSRISAWPYEMGAISAHSTGCSLDCRSSTPHA
jgi:hypothetical protein